MNDRNLRLFSHMVYEYKKGVRRLALYTCDDYESSFCVKKLEKDNISYHITPAGGTKVNIYFGDCPCIRIIESFGDKMQNEFDEKEDFILGVMLGYDITKQCERYIDKCQPEKCKSCNVKMKKGA